MPMPVPWFKKEGDRKPDPSARSSRIPEGLWIKCDNCGEIIYRKEVDRNLEVCPKCQYHFRISSAARIRVLLDEGSFVPFDEGLMSDDPLGFRDRERYADRLRDAQAKTGMNEAVVTGTGTIGGHPVVVAVMEFAFMGGSMGSVVGEKIARAAERAAAEKKPFITIAASGGARMQEGLLSLMQMAKTCAALERLSRAGVPYLSFMADPTMGGVTASFAMMGDINLGEPRALVGFAGPRVIKQTIGQDLPEGFQRSEFLIEHGMLDMIVSRRKMRETFVRILEFLKK
jgi:acetyl-CoA carboxylase carboxyl transferase subunit beta